MLIIEHRKNTIEELSRVPRDHGVEIDLRSDSRGIHLAHDPFQRGIDFESWLASYAHRFLVLNVKEEGLEEVSAELLKSAGISEYFFLDQSAPFLIKRGLNGFRDGACRWSEFENPPETQYQMCDWIWLDSILRSTDQELTVNKWQRRGLKVCVASPELHDRSRAGETRILARKTAARGIVPDAICTKYPEVWMDAFK